MVLGPVHWSRLDLPRFCFEKNELLRVPGPVALEKRPPLPTSKLLSSDRAIGFFAEAVPANDGMNRILVYYVQHKSIYIYITVCTDSTDAKKRWTWAIKIPRLPLSNTKIKCHQRWIFDHQASGHGPFLWSSIVGRKHTGDHSQTHIYLRRQGLALAQKKEATSMPRSHSGVSFRSENPRWSNNLQGGNE